MTKDQILEAFVEAETAWTVPVEKIHRKSNPTRRGLCHYFKRSGLTNAEVDNYLNPLWFKYRTVKSNSYHFNTFGIKEQGRAERLGAVRQVISNFEVDYPQMLREHDRNQKTNSRRRRFPQGALH